MAARVEAAPVSVHSARSRFTLRELLAIGMSAVLVCVAVGQASVVGLLHAGLMILVIPVLLLAIILFIARRLAPAQVWRWGSLSPDQIMSVAASIALMASLVRLVTVPESGVWGVAAIVGAVLLCGVSVAAPRIAPFRSEFSRRPASQAHPVARRALSSTFGALEFELVPVAKWRSATPRYRRTVTTAMTMEEAATTLAEADARMAAELAGSQGIPVVDDAEIVGEVPKRAGHHVSSEAGTTGLLPEDATAMEQPTVQPFWVLPPVPRQVISEDSGEPLFMISPAAWALVVQDRGTEFLIRSEDGSIGVVGDLEGFERA
ncbi:MAG: hypothetical protein ACTJHU_02370 [Mycetocola sp.]